MSRGVELIDWVRGIIERARMRDIPLRQLMVTPADYEALKEVFAGAASLPAEGEGDQLMGLPVVIGYQTHIETCIAIDGDDWR